MLRQSRNFYMIVLLAILTACAHQQSSKDLSETDEVKPSIPKREVITLETAKETSPGQVLLIATQEKQPVKKVLCEGKELPFWFSDKEKKNYFFWGESYFSEAKERLCLIYSHEGLVEKIHLKILDREYPSETLDVDLKRVSLNSKDLALVRSQQKKLALIYAQSSSRPYFTQPFRRPLESFITSHYGKKRVFNGVRKSQHLGVDLRARTGTAIPVANAGKVVFAGHLFYSGNTIIVDHGLGVFTTYGHLSRVLVRVGDRVKRGDIVGRAGSTGRVTGPHLHWGVKIDGKWLDGMGLVEQTNHIDWSF